VGDAGADGIVGWDIPVTKASRTRRRFVDSGGPIIERVHPSLIFWGTAWATTPPPAPSSDAITNALRQLLDSPYLSRLYAYRKSIDYRYPSTNGTLGGTSTVASALGTGASRSPANQPAGFTDNDVAQLVTNLVTSKFSPLRDQTNPNLLYLVITPADPSIAFNSARGEHFAAPDGDHFSRARRGRLRSGRDCDHRSAEHVRHTVGLV
jgi:hypothetical protein